MNVKKYLNKRAKQDRETLYTEQDKVFLEDLKEKADNNSKSRKRNTLKIWIPSSIGAVATILAIVCVIVFYSHYDIEYLEGNFESVKSDITEVQADLNDFSLTIDSSIYNCDIMKVKDQVSGDTIYYVLRIESFDTIKRMEIVAVTNQNYRYNAFKDTSNFLTYGDSSYSFIYQTEILIDEEYGFEILNGQAELHKAKEYIYIQSYSEILLDLEGSFIETIQDMIK